MSTLPHDEVHARRVDKVFPPGRALDVGDGYHETVYVESAVAPRDLPVQHCVPGDGVQSIGADDEIAAEGLFVSCAHNA